MRLSTYVLTAVVLVAFMGCESVTQDSISTLERALVKDADVQAAKAAFYSQRQLQAESDAGKTAQGSLSLHAFLRAAGPLMGESASSIFSELHAMAQRCFVEVEGQPNQWITEGAISRYMLTFVIPYVEEGVSDDVKLDYVERMVRSMDSGFPTIVSVLESVENNKSRVQKLAYAALVNTWALEELHKERVEEAKTWLDHPQVSEERRRDVGDYVRNRLPQQWPPRVDRADGTLLKEQIDMGDIRSRLSVLLDHRRRR